MGATWQTVAGPSQRRAVLAVGRQRAATPKKKATPKPLTPRSYGLQGGQTSCKVLTPGKLLLHWKVRIRPCLRTVHHECKALMAGMCHLMCVDGNAARRRAGSCKDGIWRAASRHPKGLCIERHLDGLRHEREWVWRCFPDCSRPQSS